MENIHVLGIDIGGTHIRLGVVNEMHEMTDFVIKKSQPIFDNTDPMDALSLVIKDYIKTNNIKVDAVSIGFPSTIDATREVVISTPNIKVLQNINVVKELSKRVLIPVFINRDVNYILLSDLKNLGDDFDNKIITGFYVGTGIGNAIMVHNRLLVGSHGIAGELGHTHVVGLKNQCGCGSTGCIETISSGQHLAEIKALYFKDTKIEDIFTNHKDSCHIIDFIDNMAIAIANEIVILDPHLIILGGGVISMKDFPKDLLCQGLYKYARKPCPLGSLNIVFVEPSQSSGVIGAGIYGINRLKDDKYL